MALSLNGNHGADFETPIAPSIGETGRLWLSTLDLNTIDTLYMSEYSEWRSLFDQPTVIATIDNLPEGETWFGLENGTHLLFPYYEYEYEATSPDGTYESWYLGGPLDGWSSFSGDLLAMRSISGSVNENRVAVGIRNHGVTSRTGGSPSTRIVDELFGGFTIDGITITTGRGPRWDREATRFIDTTLPCIVELGGGTPMGGINQFFANCYEYDGVRLYYQKREKDLAGLAGEGWFPLAGLRRWRYGIFVGTGSVWRLFKYDEDGLVEKYYDFDSFVGSDGCDGLVFKSGATYVTVNSEGC